MTPIEIVARIIDPDAWALRETLRGDRQLEERIAASESKARTVIAALAEAVNNDMGIAFDKAHVAYWDKHWVDSQDASFSKTRHAANRAGLSAALLAALEQKK